MHLFGRESKTLLFTALICTGFHSAKCEIKTRVSEMTLELHQVKQLYIEVRNFSKTNVTLSLIVQNQDMARIVPANITLNPGDEVYKVSIEATNPGHTDLYGVSSDPSTNVYDVYCEVTIYKSQILEKVSAAIGWIYFISWSVSFYPQVYVNYRRKSVVGLSFDYLALNIVGFTLYSVYNLGLYLIPEVEDEYLKRHPRGLNPVEPNDIFMAVHAALVTAVTIAQCFFYDRGDQRVSPAAKVILGVYAMVLFLGLIVAISTDIEWLTYLYLCSYIKLTVTSIKYIPQAYINYKRQSTVGWSIGNVICDFIGGLFSIVQMMLNSYNYNDWISIFGNVTKFGLGLFSVSFDVLFMIQHYLLYNDTSKTYAL